MYSYSGRGWKPTPSSSSSSSSAGQSPVMTMSTDIAEDEDEVDLKSEENDVAAPLPTSQTKQLKVKSTSAKDKRRLREKRRSTGVASLAGHQADEETVRNTSFNETAGVVSVTAAAATSELHLEHHQLHNTSHSKNPMPDDAMTTQSQQPIPGHNGSVTQHKSKPTDQTSFHSLRSHDDAQALFSEPTGLDTTSSLHHNITTTSSTFTKNLCARPFEASKRSGILKGCSRPVIPAKPESFVGGASTSSRAKCLLSNEESSMLARVAELEKLLECERRENDSIKQFLSEKDARIRDLELHIVTLNEDLDLADEDYLRLEEENRALGRALSALSTSD